MDIRYRIIRELINARLKNSADLDLFKRRVAKKYKISFPSNMLLLKYYHKLVKNKIIKPSEKIENILKKRPVRSLSGIVNVSVLTKPYACPGKCLYCPTEKGIPKSYVSGEPAVERAKTLNYDPYLQTKKRIEMLKNQGHPTDKIELRIVGGTWSFYSKNYQNQFIKKCFEACNGAKRGRRAGTEATLENEQKKNEKTKHRIIGLSIETRPDFITISEIRRLRKLGVTMVELGVQSVYDDVLKANIRGHGVKEIISATALLKNAGFKVLYQMMPNLPGSVPKRDKKMFRDLFSDSRFQPDLLKIYPCALLKEAPLYKLWKTGQYKPYGEKQLINLVKSIKKIIPYYVRIQRISRDIPSQSIVAGPAKISNLRQILSALSQKEGWRCHCIRCREVKGGYIQKEKIFLFREDYNASGGKEIFLSFENKNRDKLYSLLRLRVPASAAASKNKKYIFPVLKRAAVIRELHTYGPAVPIAKQHKAPQHQGMGKALIKTAERIAKKERGLKKIAVISGIGAREYYRKLGYALKNTYMIKYI